MKLEIYQVGKLPPLTVVECDTYKLDPGNVPRLVCKEGNQIKAQFILSNIAGFKMIEGD